MEIPTARPRMISDAPRVATIAGIPIRAIRVPLKIPHNAPIAIENTRTTISTRTCTVMPASAGIMRFSSMQPRIPARSATATTVRSMPPAIMHSMTPSDRMPISGKRYATSLA